MDTWLDRIMRKEHSPKQDCTFKKKRQRKNKHRRSTKQEREEKNKKEREREIRDVILEVLFYVVFLILLISVASNNIDTKAFGYRHSTLSFIDAKGAVGKVRTIGQFWSWMNSTLLPFLYPIKDWNLNNLTHGRLVGSFASYRVGPLRIRQHRMRDELCSIEKHFRHTGIRCVYSWSSSYMDTRNNTRTWEAAVHKRINASVSEAPPDKWTPWRYRNWWDIGGVPIIGLFGVYPTGGYVVDITADDMLTAQETLEDLRRLEWIDRFTRFVCVELSLFCPGADMFAMVPVVFEFPQADILIGEPHLYPFRLFSYFGGSYPIAKLVCDFLVFLAVGWFVTREVYKIFHERVGYFTHFWNIMELINLLLSIAAITLYIGRLIITTYVFQDIGSAVAPSSHKMDIDIETDTGNNTRTGEIGQFYNFQTLAMWNELFMILLGFVCFLSTLQLLNLLRFNRRMSHFGATLREAAKDLSAFSLVFVIVFLAFVSLCYITFGANLVLYSSVIRSIKTLVTVALGSFDYQALTHVNHILAPIFLFAYMMFIVFILINMLITILNDAFSVVRADVSKQPNDHELLDYMNTRATAFLRKVWTPVRILLGRGKDTDADASEEKTQQASSSYSKAKHLGCRDLRRPTFNTDLLRLHNRLDNMDFLVDDLIKSLETDAYGKDHFRKKRVSFSDDLLDDDDVIALSLDESGLSFAKEQVVPGEFRLRHVYEAAFDVDPSDNVVPDTQAVAVDVHPEVSHDVQYERARNVQRVDTMNAFASRQVVGEGVEFEEADGSGVYVADAPGGERGDSVKRVESLDPMNSNRKIEDGDELEVNSDSFDGVSYDANIGDEVPDIRDYRSQEKDDGDDDGDDDDDEDEDDFETDTEWASDSSRYESGKNARSVDSLGTNDDTGNGNEFKSGITVDIEVPSDDEATITPGDTDVESPNLINSNDDTKVEDVENGTVQDQNMVQEYVHQIELGTFSHPDDSPSTNHPHPVGSHEGLTPDNDQENTSSFISMPDDSSTNEKEEELAAAKVQGRDPGDDGGRQAVRYTTTQKRKGSSDEVVVDIDDNDKGDDGDGDGDDESAV